MDPSPIFVLGFMGAGKTAVGRLVASRLGRRFVDLDERVAVAAGRSIPELFRDEGEAGFRRREAEALAVAANERDVVVACGGGTPVAPENLARMRERGVTVSLVAPLDVLLARVRDPSTRPLLAGGSAEVERLFRAREPVYRAADVVVDARGTATRVAGVVAARVTLRLGDARVRLDGGRGYPIHVAPLARAGEVAAELLPEARAIALVTDENVAAAGHAAVAAAVLAEHGARVTEVVIPPGETQKTLATVERVAGACVDAGLDRRGAIVALGGGVVGDVAGFVAAILLRGVACAQLPTTLLAMVDSSIGGKTGVDLPAGKNLVGAFWQPRFVLADPATLVTLPARERRAAMGEVLKYGLLGDAPLFATLAERGDAGDAVDLVVRCARMKADVVSADEHETTGRRALLNLGHTVGHAIEAASRYDLLHGEAVALGLVAAARVSAALGLCDRGLPDRVTAAVARCGLDADLDPWLRDDVLAFVGVDKKRVGEKVRFIALEDVGRPRVVELRPAEVAELARRGV